MTNIYDLPHPVSHHYLIRYMRFISTIQNSLDVVTEKHHIIPESMGGTNHSFNLINLTPRQHYLAHWMLWKAYKSKEMTAAFFSMSNQNNQHQHRNFKINSKVYEKLRLDFVNQMSVASKNLWSNADYRAKHAATNQKEQTKQLRSLKAKELWQNPEYRSKMNESRKRTWAEGRFVRDHSKCGSKGDTNPAKRPEVRAKNSGINHYSKREGYERPSCPHCGVVSTPTNILRWHGNNCKKL